jgi:hypothetical protein
LDFRSRARSAEVTMKAPPASEIRQQSSMPSGSAMGLASSTSSSVTGFFMCALGCSSAWAARVDRHVRELLARGAVHVHVALGDHRVVAGDRAAIGLLEIGMAHGQQRRQRGVAREAGGAVLAGAHQDGLGLAGWRWLRRRA